MNTTIRQNQLFPPSWFTLFVVVDRAMKGRKLFTKAWPITYMQDNHDLQDDPARKEFFDLVKKAATLTDISAR